MDELTLAYTDTRSEDYEKVVEYKVEVWAWKKDHMEKVYEGEPFQFNGDGQAVRFVYLEDGTIGLLTEEHTTSAITVYYGYTGEKFEEQKTVEADIGTLSVKINGEEVTEQEWEEYLHNMMFQIWNHIFYKVMEKRNGMEITPLTELNKNWNTSSVPQKKTISRP